MAAPMEWPCPAVAFSSFSKANALWWEEEGIGREGATRKTSTLSYPGGTPWQRETPTPSPSLPWLLKEGKTSWHRDLGLNPSSATPWLCDLAQVAQPLCFSASSPQIPLTQVLSNLVSGCDP